MASGPAMSNHKKVALHITIHGYQEAMRTALNKN